MHEIAVHAVSLLVVVLLGIRGGDAASHCWHAQPVTCQASLLKFFVQAILGIPTHMHVCSIQVVA